MYPILEYSSKYLILEYYVYFHTYTLYICPVFVESIYMYILTMTRTMKGKIHPPPTSTIVTGLDCVTAFMT